MVAVYSTFAQRAVDCVIHDVCLQRLPVILCLDRAGIVGDDGPTHHGVFDLALFRNIPNLVIMQPADGAELAHMLCTATQLNGPAIIRYPRGTGPRTLIPETLEALPVGQASVVRDGWEIQIWALGDMLPLAAEVADRLTEQGFSAGLVNARFVCPLDVDMLREQSEYAKAFVTLENAVVAGGFGTAVTEALTAMQSPAKVLRFGWPNQFICHGAGNLLMEQYGLTPAAITESVVKALA